MKPNTPQNQGKFALLHSKLSRYMEVAEAATQQGEKHLTCDTEAECYFVISQLKTLYPRLDFHIGDKNHDGLFLLIMTLKDITAEEQVELDVSIASGTYNDLSPKPVKGLS